MASLRFEGRSIELQDGETVLEGLLGDGRRIPHSCRAGACRSCLMRAVEGRPPESAQVGLNDGQKARGYFLACVARPSEPLVVDLGGEGLQRTRVVIASIERIGENVIRVLLDPESGFDYRPGQFLTLIRDDGLARSYSIASLPDRDRSLELHVKVLEGGRMSRWLADEARPGDRASIQGPSGDCFYVPGQEDQEIVLAGTGTGLAPLFGIAQDALRRGHRAPVTLFHGARGPEGLYLAEQLRGLERQFPTFRYVPSCIDGEPREGIEIGLLETVVLGRISTFQGRRVYLCGNPAMVQSLRKKVFLKGARMKEVFADAFLAAPVPVG
ncbi:2Fe-2S iron-sulfur cluster-binding protein [Tundrisphaera lichenicola]|uniref:2Fe-2S iron-sulfur cluster-binding protein n=1 Tax=Tundrisphaera lichenicola TaxID=2029860 RepID=UPI003EBBEFC0